MAKSATPSYFSWFWQGIDWCKKTIITTKEWCFPSSHVYSKDESGVFIERALAYKSWFDAIASFWYHLGMASKFSIILATSAVAALIGLCTGTPLIFGLIALIFVISSHFLLVAHERHRYKTVQTIAKEVKALQHDLETSKTALSQSRIAADQATNLLKDERDHLQVLVDDFRQTSSRLEDPIVQTLKHTGEMELVTTQLVKAQEEVSSTLQQTTQAVNLFGEVITTGQQHLNRFGVTTNKLEQAVNALSDTQIRYTQAVSRVGLFVSSMHQIPTLSCDATLEEIDQTLAESARIIAENHV